MPPDSTPSNDLWVGIDIAEAHVDYSLFNRKDNPSGRRPRRAAALAKRAKKLRAMGVTHALLEASGGYEREAWAALEAAGIVVTVSPPSRVRQFARACGIEAKTDGIDAAVAARFGAAVSPDPTPLPSAEMSRDRDLLRHLNSVVEERARLRTRRHRAHESLVRASIDRIVKQLSKEIEKLEAEVQRALEAMPEAAALAKRLQQAAGVGKKTAWARTAELPELGQLTGKAGGGAGGLGAARPRQRRAQRPALDRRRTQPIAQGALHGGADGGPRRPPAQGFL